MNLSSHYIFEISLYYHELASEIISIKLDHLVFYVFGIDFPIWAKYQSQSGVKAAVLGTLFSSLLVARETK